MMSRKWLLLDCNYLCHRAKHTTGGLKHGNTPTGVIYGFLKTISALQEMFNTPHVAFCWDSKTSLRTEIFPDYKSNRRDKYADLSKKEIAFEKAFRQQMKKLRQTYLPTIGYRNVFCQKGYESDDIIASICLHSLRDADDTGVIISSDSDLYQLLSPMVSLYNPITGKQLTRRAFVAEHGINPSEWRMVKSIAGCSTDGIPGVPGVGVKTAVKYLRGKLNETTKAYKAITSMAGVKRYAGNRVLVALPYHGTKIFKLKRDKISEEGWKQVTSSLGMKSIRDKPPIFRRSRKRSLA